VKFERFKKFYRRKQTQVHNSKPFVQSRQLEEFEILLIEALGGREILQSILAKTIPQNLDYLYQWVDPAKIDSYNFGDFLAVESKDECYQLYD